MKGRVDMDMHELAYQYLVKAVGYDAKVSIIYKVAKEMGKPGIIELARLTGKDPRELEQYANLPRFYEDLNRRRRQRKPKKRPTAGNIFSKEIEKQLVHWR